MQPDGIGCVPNSGRKINASLVALGLFGCAFAPASTALSSMQRTILWFRNDLRLHDNPLLHHPAVKIQKKELLCVYCADPATLSGRLRQTGLPKVGARRSKFLQECVQDLRESLRLLGSDLMVAAAKPDAWLPELAESEAEKIGSVVVIVAQGVTPEEQQDEAAVEAALAALPRPARLERVWSLSMYHIEDLPYANIFRDFPMVFAPFGRTVRGNFRAADASAVAAAQRGEQGVPIREELETPKSLPALPERFQSMAGKDISDIWPKPADSDAVYSGQGPSSGDSWWLSTFWGGEEAGQRRLADFIQKDLARYKETRNGLIGLHFSSKLSPWVAAGCVSPRRVVAEVRRWELDCRKGRPTASSAHYVSEYGWRDFLIFLALKCGASLFKLKGPGKVQAPWPWVRDEMIVQRLLQGRTGMPLVDAAIREMAVSGFMSNRARQYVASYITLELKVDWRIGAELFESLLIDYDVCANWGNWMRAAGVSGQGFGNSGSRWFNLAEERDRFDPKGEYVRLWLPELQAVPARYIHAPWSMTKEVQMAAQCLIGQDYPAPPDTASKFTLNGASPKDVAPTWYATTRASKIETHGQTEQLPGHVHKGQGRGGLRLSRPNPPSGSGDADESLSSRSQAVKRRWNRKSRGGE
mmetsp:Transcript_28592/g.51838  ORF Transcript_28592/g.51838 Transcript_28592/m.51838 type:complete len:642 (+) Transcript_28592:50-1975(+)